jgi:hypothetical protein
MAAPRQSLAQRLEQGDHWLRQALDHWLQRSHRTTRQMAAIASWSVGEVSPLSHSIINRLINRKIKPSFAVLIAMDQLNNALWLWHTQGSDVAITQLGPPSCWTVDPAWLDEAIWLPMPDKQEPLTLCNFAEVLAGRLELPYLGA